LTLARLGILPFFWLACWLVGRFVARSCGRWHAAVAVFFFALCPPVLANAAVATTDLPFTAMFLWAFVCFWSFLRNPKPLQAVLSGITVGLALLCKLSGLPYLIFPYAGLCIYHVIQKGKLPSWRYFGIAGVALVFTIWAGYRFSVGPILHEGQLRAVEAEQLRRLPAPMTKLFFIRGVPAPQFFKGMAQAYGLSQKQRTGYIFGQTYEGGRWYFFPVAIAVKTPIPLLLLAMVGAARAIMRPRPPVVMAALIAIAGPLGFAMISPVNLGVRHILIIYPFLAMLGAYGLLWLWQAGSSREKIVAYRGVALALLIWSLVTCLRAAPDFIPYFNEAAAPYGSRILVDSDFDWGQDLKRLSAVLQQQRIGFLWIAYEGSADLTPQGIPPSRPLLPNQRPAGWVAISEFCIKTAPQDFGWLEKYQPERVVGKTIRLYHFDSTPAD